MHKKSCGRDTSFWVWVNNEPISKFQTWSWHTTGISSCLLPTSFYQCTSVAQFKSKLKTHSHCTMTRSIAQHALGKTLLLKRIYIFSCIIYFMELWRPFQHQILLHGQKRALGYIIIFCKMLTTQEIVNNFFWAGNSLKNNVCSVFIFWTF